MHCHRRFFPEEMFNNSRIFKKNHRAWKANEDAQSARRGVVQAAAQWAAWSWSKQVYITDSAMVERGIRQILTNQKLRDLWKNIIVALRTKVVHNHKVQKVKAHQGKQKTLSNSLKK